MRRPDQGAQAPSLQPGDGLGQLGHSPAAPPAPLAAVAIVDRGGAVSYPELEQRLARLTARLRRAGVGAEVRVGVLLSRGARLPLTLLAVLRAGGAYVPLDPGHPDQRLRALCRDAGVAVVVSEAATRARMEALLAVPGHGRAPVRIDLDEGDTLAAHEAEADAADAAREARGAPRPDQLAYVIYTSGSSGAPKGVMVARASLAHHVAATLAAYRLEPGDRVLQFAAAGFDVSLEEIVPTLTAGATLVMAPEEPWTSFAAFSSWLEQQRISVLNLPASWWHAWVAELERGAAAVPACVRLVVVGSEAVHPAAYAAWVAKVGARVQWRNGYGPTEATITATLFDPRAPSEATTDLATAELPTTEDPTTELEAASSAMPIGTPLAGRTAQVLDERLAPVVPEIAGTLYLGGAGVARGYLGQAALTAERFVPDPLGAPGARRYDTGDRVVARRDGTLEFLGRRDRQVKIRGHRVEPEELERALAAHPQVAEAAVTTRALGDGELELLGYVVPRDPELEVTALRGDLARRLPAYLLPAALTVLPALPRGATGKLDRAALPRPTLTAGPTSRAPATATERTLAAIFEEVLEVTAVGAGDGFHQLGGHSLAAMRVIGRVRERLGVELPLRALFEAQTPEALARVLEAAPRSAGSPFAAPAPPRPERIPLSFPQQQVWLLHQLEPDNVAYTAPTILRLDGALDLPALQRSVDELICRHEILRTTFPAIDGQPVQVIHPPAPLPIEVTELAHLAPEEREAAAERCIAAELRRPFSLERLPLLRFHLLRLGDDRQLLVVVEHHLVHDGWSTNVLFTELFALYAAFAAGQPSPLPPPALQFADFVLWHHRWLDGAQAERQRRYWTDRLAGAPPRITLAADREPSAAEAAGVAVAPRFRGSALRMHLPAELDERIRARCRLEGVSPYVMLLATYVVLLHRHARQRELMIGTGIANRRWRETETMLGMIINTIVLRAEVRAGTSFRELLGQLRALTVEAADHQDLPFERIVEALQPERVPGQNPIFQVIFGLHDAPLAPIELPGLRWAILESPSNGSAKFDLGLIVIPRPEARDGWHPGLGERGYTLIWEFNSERFDAATIEQLQLQYRVLLEAALAAPEQAVERLPLASAEQRLQQLERWRATASPYPRQLRVEQRFARCVAAHPDAPAIRDGQQRLSYREVHERAQQVTRRLRALGVRPREVVALCSDRSADMVVAMLGILGAGATYLPLDATYPAERLALMIADCGATRALVTREAARGALPAAMTVLQLDELAGPTGEPADELAGPTGAPPDEPSPRDVAAEALEAGAPLPDRAVRHAHHPDASDVAYVVYTSGSTGRPKGVAAPHRAVVRLVLDTNYLALAPGDRMLQISPLTFDGSTIEIWGALLNGAELVVVPTSTVLSPGGLYEAIREHALTAMFITTALFDRLIDDRPDTFAPVHDLMVGGEAMNAARVSRALRHGAPLRMSNVYGPTEGTGLSSWYPIPAAPDPARRVPIGHAVSNTTLYVLDGELQPAPVGVPGELHVGGDGLAEGYLARPRLTAERFLPDPFATEPGARMYATGDLVRSRPDGELEFLARVDAQVKIRGHRIEPGEIEAVLRSHPGVRDAVAVVRRRTSGDQELLAFVTGQAGAPPPPSPPRPAELRRWLQARLPPYLLPALLVVLDELPVNRNGKVDRDALVQRAPQREAEDPDEDPAKGPAEDPAEHAGAGGAAASRHGRRPATVTEAAVAEIWRELLGVEEVELDDNFFARGGNSLQIMQLLARVQRRLGIALPVGQVFAAPTVAAMAHAVERAVERAGDRAGERAPAEGAQLLELVATLEGLSDDDAHALLGES